MGLTRRLYLFTTTAAIIALAVALSLILSWQTVNLALEKEDYARQVEGKVYLLQQNILTEQSSHLAHNFDQNWLDVHEDLTEHLSKATPLKARQQTLKNSIVSQNKSLLLLYKQLKKFSPIQKTSAIETHLTTRLLGQIESIREDSQQLAAIAKADIRETIQQQLIQIIIILGLGGSYLVYGTFKIIRWLRSSIAKLQKGIEEVSSGRYELIEQSRTSDEFETFIEKFNQMSEQLEKTTVTRDVLQQIVEERTDVLKQIANTDSLTQVANRRALFERGQMEFSRACRHHFNFTLLILDCDFFKKVNDTFGHLVGDNVLIHLCRVCEKEIRDIDFIARYGGEEFVILLPHCSAEDGVENARRIQRAIAGNCLYKDDQVINLTVSIGVASMNERHESFEQLLNAADDALLIAKSNGRNRVEITAS